MSYKSKTRWTMKRKSITTRDRIERYYQEREYKKWQEKNSKSYEVKRVVKIIGDEVIYNYDAVRE